MRIASQSESLLDEIFNWLSQFPNKPVLGTVQGRFCLQTWPKSRTIHRCRSFTKCMGRQRFSFEAPVKVSLETPEKSHESTLSYHETSLITNHYQFIIKQQQQKKISLEYLFEPQDSLKVQ